MLDRPIYDQLKILEDKLQEAALKILDSEINSTHYSQPEKLAMLKFTQLALIKKLDMGAFMMRGSLLKQIEDMQLWRAHPMQFNSMEEAAKYYKLSSSVLSNVRDWYNIIFPYLENHMGMTVPEIWEEIEFSNFREITPVLKALITGKEPKGESARNAVNMVMEEVRSLPNGDSTEAAVRWTLDAAEKPNRELRKILRPEHTPPIHGILIKRNSSTFLLAELSEDQQLLLERVAGRHIDFTYLEEAPAQIPIVRRLLEK